MIERHTTRGATVAHIAIEREPMTDDPLRKRRRNEFPSLAEARKRYKHGTRGRYCIGKCRCARCRKAIREYETARLARRRKPWRLRHIAPSKTWLVCSTSSKKIAFRSKSKAEAKKRLEKLNASFVSTDPTELIPTAEVVNHIRWLQANGLGVKTISARSRVASSVLTRIVDRDIERTRRSTAKKILAVRPDEVREGTRVRVDESLVLIDRLVKAGYRRAWIAKALGARTSALQIAKTPYITVRHARAIHALYQECGAVLHP
jgi:hypothetical protein